MKRENDPRHLARTLAVQYLFSKDFPIPKEIQDSVLEYDIEQLQELDEIEGYHEELYSTLVTEIPLHLEEIDPVIVKYAPQWPIEQIKKVDLAIMRIAILEGFILKITPPKVAIDEAIELAKEFGGNASDKFVNGVLGAIYDKLKPENESNSNS